MSLHAGTWRVPRLLLITGSTRLRSTNTAALRTAHELQPDSSASVYDALPALPAFNADDDHDPLPPEVAALRAAIAAADAVVFCTPEYAGTLPGRKAVAEAFGRITAELLQTEARTP